jgi:hypothetical protein
MKPMGDAGGLWSFQDNSHQDNLFDYSFRGYGMNIANIRRSKAHG